MIERFMGSIDLTPEEDALYMAAMQVRGGVDIDTVLKWYSEVCKEDLNLLLTELAEYDDWRGNA